MINFTLPILVCCVFSVIPFKILSNVFLNFSLTCRSCRSTLPNFPTSGDVLDTFLLLIFISMLLWSQNASCVISILLNILKLVWCSRISLLGEFYKCSWRKVPFVAVGCSMRNLPKLHHSLLGIWPRSCPMKVNVSGRTVLSSDPS